MEGIRAKKEKAEKYQAFLDSLDLEIDKIIPTPVKLTNLMIGNYVTYVDTYREDIQYAHGRVRNFSVDEHIVFVVYNCDNEWHSYMKYTAQATDVMHLYPGWLSEEEVKKIPKNI